MKVNRQLSVVGRKQRGDSFLEDRRLKKQSLTGFLRVPGNSNVECIDEWLLLIGHVFDLDIRQFRSTHSSFDHLLQRLFSLCLRVVFVLPLSLNREMTGIFVSEIAF